MKCISCGVELKNEIDTFGDHGHEMCWDCWATEEGHDNQWYGMAPHHHNLAVTGSFIGSTVLDPLPEPNEHGEYWIADMGAWFKPDDEVDGAQGMWRKP